MKTKNKKEIEQLKINAFNKKKKSEKQIKDCKVSC